MGAMRPADTSPEADRKQFELLRQATPARRLKLARSLTATTMRLSRQALRKRNPNASERELDISFVELCYGKELAGWLRTYLEARS